MEVGVKVYLRSVYRMILQSIMVHQWKSQVWSRR